MRKTSFGVRVTSICERVLSNGLRKKKVGRRPSRQNSMEDVTESSSQSSVQSSLQSCTDIGSQAICLSTFLDYDLSVGSNSSFDEMENDEPVMMQRVKDTRPPVEKEARPVEKVSGPTSVVRGQWFWKKVVHYALVGRVSKTDLIHFLYGSTAFAKDICDSIEIILEELEDEIIQGGGMTPHAFTTFETNLVSFLTALLTYCLEPYVQDISMSVVYSLNRIRKYLDFWGTKHFLKIRVYQLQMLVQEHRRESPLPPLFPAQGMPRTFASVSEALSSAKPVEFANAVTALLQSIVLRLSPKEVIYAAEDSPKLSPSWHAIAVLSEKVSGIVVADIVTRGAAEVSATIEKYILIARLLRHQNNYSSFFAVMRGLTNPCVQRLRPFWGSISEDSATRFIKNEAYLSPVNDYGNYRVALESAVRPIMPYFFLYDRYMRGITEGCPDLHDSDTAAPEWVLVTAEQMEQSSTESTAPIAFPVPFVDEPGPKSASSSRTSLAPPLRMAWNMSASDEAVRVESAANAESSLSVGKQEINKIMVPDETARVQFRSITSVGATLNELFSYIAVPYTISASPVLQEAIRDFQIVDEEVLWDRSLLICGSDTAQQQVADTLNAPTFMLLASLEENGIPTSTRDKLRKLTRQDMQHLDHKLLRSIGVRNLRERKKILCFWEAFMSQATWKNAFCDESTVARSCSSSGYTVLQIGRNDFAEWTCSDILTWMKRFEFSQEVFESFKKRELCGSDIINLLHHSQLKHIGLTKPHDRKLFIHEVRALLSAEQGMDVSEDLCTWSENTACG